MEKLVEEQEIKKYSKIQWFFVVILIPTIFALMVAVLVASVAGINVVDKAKEFSEKLPFMPTDEEVRQEKKINEMETKLTELQAEVKDREEAIKELENEIEGKDKQLETLKLEKEQLQIQINELTNTKEGQQSFKDIVSTFEKMSAKNAAPIITQMNEEESIKILSSLKPDILSAILEKMEPDVAAKFTTLLANNSSQNSGN